MVEVKALFPLETSAKNLFEKVQFQNTGDTSLVYKSNTLQYKANQESPI